MASQLTADDAKQSLIAHVESKGIEVFVKYGPQIGWGELQRVIADRAYVRYPCRIEFDAAPLLPGEFAHPVQQGAAPEEGFTMFVHPRFMLELDRVAYLVLYQLVAINYGEFASADEAETFGAAALGLTRDEYYTALCAMSDEIGGDAGVAVAPAPGCEWEPPQSQGCTCGGSGGHCG
jgi:hypothetical protein